MVERIASEALARELSSSDESAAIAIEADVTDRTSLEQAATRVRDELGRADVLINNAGQMLLAPFSVEHCDETRQMVETNLLGAMTATEVFLEQLQDGGGDLVNISSVAARTAKPGSSVYNATKWGLNGWSEALRQELQPAIRVIVIEPGAVDTELTAHITHADSKKASEQLYADVEAIAPEDVADVIAFAIGRPAGVSLNEILIRPTKQAL